MPDEEDELALGGDDHETEETGLGGEYIMKMGEKTRKNLPLRRLVMPMKMHPAIPKPTSMRLDR